VIGESSEDERKASDAKSDRALVTLLDIGAQDLFDDDEPASRYPDLQRYAIEMGEIPVRAD